MEVMVLYRSNVLANQMLLETIAINVLMDSMDFQIVKVGLFFNISERNYLILHYYAKFWDISFSGCKCNIRSSDGTCNEQTGYCFCRPGYYGDTCDERKITKGKT